MKKLFLLLILCSLSFVGKTQTVTLAQLDSAFIRENFVKTQYEIEMRDGVKLFTNVYTPKDASPSNQYPMLMQRTCYDVAPYGKDEFPKLLSYSRHLMREKFIFVYQDVHDSAYSQ